MTRALRYNDELRESGSEKARWRVVEPMPLDGCVKLFDREKRIEEVRELSDINDDIVDGKLILSRKDAPKISAAAQDDPKLDHAIQQVMTHVRVIEELQKKHGISINMAYKIAKQEPGGAAGATEGLPSRASIYRYAKAKRSDLPPLMGDKNKGNRLPRYDENITDLICRTANTLYLVEDSRWTLYDLAMYVNDRSRENGWLSSGQKVSQDYIRNVIYKNESVDPEIDRMDPKLVAAAKSIAKNRIVAAFPFDRVEQDALHLPFVANTAHGPASNMYLIHAIDCSSGMVVGWYLMIGAPSESDGLKCVESILFPKKKRLKTLGLSYDIDIYGTPHQLIFDNGPETRGERMTKLVRLDIDAMHCKSRHAHGKPYIERLNRSLKEALQTLPGSTRVDGKDGQRDPVKLQDSLMTFEELERRIVRWYFESWANTELKRHLRTDFHDEVKLGNTPIKRWKTMTQELAYAMPLSPPMSEWLMTLYEHEARTLNRKTGITCRGFNYRGDNMTYLVKKYGETQLNILINPDDYRTVYVDEGNGQALLALTEEFVTSTTPGYSFTQITAMLKEQKGQQTESEIKTKFRKDVQEHSLDAGKKPPRKQSKAEANRAMADQVKEAQAVNRAIQNPLAPPMNNTNGFPEITVSFDEAPALPVLSKTSGEEQR